MRFKPSSIVLYLQAQSHWLRYCLLLLSIAAATLITLYIPQIDQQTALLLFFFAIIQLSSWLGPMHGVIAATSFVLAANVFVQFPTKISLHDQLLLNVGFCFLSLVTFTSHLYQRLAQALRESRQDLAHTQSVAQIGSWRLNKHCNELSWSDQNHHIFGIARGSPLSNDTFLAAVHPDDRDYVKRVWQAGLSGEAYDIEHRLIVAGQVKWVREKMLPEFDKDGTLLGGFGTTQDITERKHAENALRDRETELRLIMDATPALISYLDKDFRYLRVNATYEKWLGVAAENVIGQHTRAIIGQEAWSIVQPYLEQALAGERVNFDQRLPYRQAKPRWVNVTYIPDVDSIGKVKGIVVHVVDITERKQAELKINLLNQRLQRRIHEMQVIFNTVPIGLSIADTSNGSTIRGNRAIERMLGLQPYTEFFMQTMSAEFCAVMQNGRELATDEWPMQRAIRGETVANQTMNIIGQDGQSITVLCNASPLLDDDGHPRGAVAAFMDITALNLATEAVRSSEAFVRDVLNSLPEQVVVLNDQGVVFAVNEPWERFAHENGGTVSDSSVGVNYLEVCRRSSAAGDHDAQKAVEGIEALLSGQQRDFLMEYLCPTPKGELWFLMYAKRVTQGFQGVIITHVNITELKHTHTELHEAEARLALVVEEVKAGYWDWDLSSSTLFLSSEWKRQIGFDDQELCNRWEAWESRLHPEDSALVLTATEDYIAGRQPAYELEFRLRHKNGSYRWIHSRASLLRDKNDQPYRLLGLNMDITDYKHAKEMDARRDQLEQSFRLHVATQTAAAIAHELNQPLTAISSYADVALHLLQTGNPNPEKLTQVLENCSIQAQRAGEVIRQLLTQLQKGDSVSELLDINALVHQTTDLVRVDGLLEGYTLKMDLAADLPKVNANALQIQKVLINLLRNGLESMREMGAEADSIIVATQRSEVDPAKLQVSVSDSGKGVINTAELKKIFQPFYTTKSTGLGMGLSISRSLIAAHDGKMWAEQNAGNGITIYFTLPFAI